MIKILVADDHPVVRQGLSQIIGETSDMVVADEAISGQEVLIKIMTGHYDVVLLDMTMPGMHGLDVIKQIRIGNPRLPILILSIYPEEQYAVRALKAGAAGYLTKDKAPVELLDAIRKVSAGRKYVSSSLAERLADVVQGNARRLPYETLSDREFQVMSLIANGKTVKEIGKTLSLSVKTISTYRSRILEKMKVKNNAELTRYAIENRLLEE